MNKNNVYEQEQADLVKKLRDIILGPGVYLIERRPTAQPYII